MAIPNATKQAAADAIKALGNWVAVYTNAAGTTGANEATGGGYERLQSTLTSGANGSFTGSQVTLAVAAGTYKEGGLHSAKTAGTFVGSAPFTNGDVTVSGTGATIKVTPSLTAG